MLFDRYYDEIRNFAFRRCKCIETADDISQTVFIRVARSIPEFRHDSSFRSWLYRIAVNAIRDVLRQQHRYDRNLAAYGESASSPESATSIIPASILHAIQLIESLPESLRETVVLVCAQGLSQREAADALGCAEGTVAWRISEARRYLNHLQETTRS